ncbi:MAG TPA: hypothetical protein VLZ11_08955 [Flavobacterium sp.]|nr:hypothetical protein [Flavobacterium sp.]
MRILLLLSILLVACITTAQDRAFRYGINEVSYTYAETYSPPDNIEFIFVGKASYSQYFFTDLQREILRAFDKKNIQIAFRYLDKKTHYSSIKTTEQTKAMYYLSIDESISIEERAGFDRVVSFNFSGKLIDASDFSEKFSFKSIAIAIHDINQQNKDLANYLFSRLYFN